MRWRKRMFHCAHKNYVFFPVAITQGVVMTITTGQVHSLMGECESTDLLNEQEEKVAQRQRLYDWCIANYVPFEPYTLKAAASGIGLSSNIVSRIIRQNPRTFKVYEDGPKYLQRIKEFILDLSLQPGYRRIS